VVNAQKEEEKIKKINLSVGKKNIDVENIKKLVNK